MGSAVVARASVCFLICSAVAAPAFPCTVRSLTTARQLVQQARVSLRVRAETISISPRQTTPPDNEGTVPYSFVRREGRHGNCFARQYRQGAEYLLFLNMTAAAPALHPYWAPLAPVNEQVVGEADPWV